MEAVEVAIGVGAVELHGTLRRPRRARGIVLFAHGSGSSRFSPRNRQVAAALEEADLATLLFDLLTAEEEPVDAVTRRLRFDIDLLAARLAGATRWVQAQAPLRLLPIGYFGASTGAAAALVAASRLKGVGAIVSRGGRPDLAGEVLPRVRAPTLLIVGGADREVLALNRAAQAQMRCPTRLEIVQGATHLFEEPGALEQVAALAAGWFTDRLGAKRSMSGPDRPTNDLRR